MALKLKVLKENELLFRFEADVPRLAIYRIFDENGHKRRLMFVTEVLMSELTALPIKKAEHWLGQILAFQFSGLRESLYPKLKKKKDR